MEIRRPDGTQLPENHHLDYRPGKGDLRMKVTVKSEDPRFVGRRIFLPLHTKDITTARLMRDVALLALDKAGVLSRRVEIDSEEMAEGDKSWSGDSDIEERH